MRRSDARLAAVACLLLAACDASDQPNRSVATTSGAPAGETVPCAHGDAAPAADCTVERQQDGDGLVLVLRHPDGGFRRLRVTRDGQGVVAADGAQPAAVRIVGGRDIDVAIGGDHYRLPATIRAAR